MKKFLLWIIPAVALIGLIGWRFAAKSAGDPAKGGPGGGAMKGRAGGGMTGRSAGGIETAVATKETLATKIEAVGNVVTPFKISVSPKSSGRIDYLKVRVGDPVEPGQVLVKIDPADLQGAVLQQRAAVAEAKSRLAQAQITEGSNDVGIATGIEQQLAAVQSATADLNQVRRNYDATVAAAQAGVNDATARVNSAQASVKSAQAGVANAQANAANAQVKYDRTYDLYKKGYIAAQDVDDARTQVDVAKGQVETANQAVSVAQSNVRSAQATLSSATANLQIVKRKGQADIAASQAKLSQAQSSLKLAKSNRSQSPAYRQNIAALRASVEAAQAQLAQAESRLNDTTLRSSIRGTVTARNLNEGDLASPGSAVLEVQFLDWLYVSTSIPVEQSAMLHQGQTATIQLDALPGKTFVGPITNINGAADPTSRQVTVLIRIDNREDMIKPGMYGQVAIQTGTIRDAVVIPQEAITKTDEGATVTTIDSDSVAHVVLVKTGASQNGKVQILSGVKAGDQVVTLSYNPIKDGSKVSLNEGGDRRPGAGNRGSR